MAFDIPTDLIRDVQITLRKHAGIPSYDPSDSSLPSLPSLNDAISGGFDQQSQPSSHLRCTNCNGMFLRGLDSFICVYCGREQKKDAAPDPIRFTSTVAYRWLLDALDLDGSETIGPPVEESESNRGQNRKQNDEILLSGLLDLEIKWSEESEKVEEDITNRDSASLQGKPAVNLAEAEHRNYFTEAKNKDTVAASERKLSQNTESYTSQENINLFENVETVNERSIHFANWEVDAIERNLSQGPENLHSAENVRPSKNEEGSANDKSGDRFSGWEEEFQSGISEPLEREKDSSSYDAMVDSTVDLSAHMDTIFGLGNIAKEVKPKEDSAPFASTTNNLTEEADMWSEFNSGVANKTELIEAATSISRIQDEQWKISEAGPTNNETRDESESFDTWNDFTSSINKVEPSDCPWIQIEHEQRKISETGQTNNETKDDSESFDKWNDFTSSINKVEPSDSLWSQSEHEQRKISETGPTNNETKDDSESFDTWNNFTSSINKVEPSDSPWSQSEHEQRKISETGPTNNETRDESESFDTWNDFTSSINKVEPSDSPWIQSEHEQRKISETGQTNNETKDDSESFDKWNDFTSSINKVEPSDSPWSQSEHEQRKISETGPTNNETKDDSESFDTWNDFTSSINKVEPSDSPWSQSEHEQRKISETGPTNNETKDDSESFDTWNDFTSSINKVEPSDSPWIQSEHEQRKISETGPTNNETKDDSESFDTWNDFTSSINKVEPSDSPWSQSEHEQRKISETGPTNNETKDDSDSSDTWNDFTSSINKVELSDSPWSQSGKQFLPSSDPTLEKNLFSSPSNLQSMDFSSFEGPDLFTGTSINKNDPKQVDFMQFEALVRTNDKNVKDEATTSSEAAEVEMIMSQMHDLSFMLATNLSIPKR